MLRLYSTLGAFLLTLALSGTATAARAPNNAQLFEMIKALQARITALEQQNRTHRQEVAAARKDADSTRLQLASLTRDGPRLGADRHPMQVGEPAPASTNEVVKHGYNWSGLYWGASFGLGATTAKARAKGVSASYSQDSDVTRIPRLAGTNFNRSTIYDTSIESAVGGTEYNEGAVIDLFLGLNKQVTSRIVAGGQIEGSLSELDFSTQGVSNTSGYIVSVSDVGSFAPGVTDRTTTSNLTGVTSSSGSITSDLEAEWMVSVLGRVGWLATPSTLLYGLAGWTYASFDLDDAEQINDFEAHGLTLGAGVEKRLSPRWSLRAEYRFTDFEDREFIVTSGAAIADNRVGTDTVTLGPPPGPGIFVESLPRQVSSSTTASTVSAVKFENDMHIGRIGVTRYFNLGKRR